MYVLAIDQGTTSTRAIAFDQSGRQVSLKQKPLTQYYPQPGWCEHDPNEILASCKSLLKEISTSLDGEIAAVGICNQRETVVAWDKLTGQPLHRAIVWLDTRTEPMVSSLKHMNNFRSLTGLPVSTYFSSLKIRWLIRNVPAVAEALDLGRCMFGTIDAWLSFKLVGRAVTDVTNASRYNLLDLRTLQWSTEVCEGYGIPIESLPEIVSSSEVVGHLLVDLSAKNPIPLASLFGDQQAALYGQGCVEPGNFKVTFGTGSFVLVNAGVDMPEPSTSLLLTVGYQIGPDAPISYAFEGSIATAGRMMELLKSLGIVDNVCDIEKIAADSSEGVVIVPAFTGLLAPQWRPEAKGVVLGLTLKTDRSHVCRAALEAVALQVNDIIEEVKKVGVDLYGPVLADGGMTGNKLLMKIQADVLDKEVQCSTFREATAWGCALAAGIAVGFYPKPTGESFDDFRSCQGETLSYKPDMGSDTRSQLIRQFREAVPRSY